MPKTRRKIGKCCAGSLCKHPKHELRAEHTCPKCNKIVHALCGVFDHHLDKYCCQPCVDKKYAPLPLNPPVVATPVLVAQPNERRTKRCSSCGGTFHKKEIFRKMPT